MKEVQNKLQQEASEASKVVANAATTGDEQNNEPEYRTVAFIKLNKLGGGGAFLLNML